MRGNHDQLGEKNHSWKGDNAKYSTIHDWIRKYKPKPETCERCGQKRHIECANISGLYKRDINDFVYVCVPCHFKIDVKTKGFVGRKHTSKSKEKMCVAKKGGTLPNEQRENISKSIKEWWNKRKDIHREQIL